MSDIQFTTPRKVVKLFLGRKIVKQLFEQNVVELWIKDAKTGLMQKRPQGGPCQYSTLSLIRLTSIGNNTRRKTLKTTARPKIVNLYFHAMQYASSLLQTAIAHCKVALASEACSYVGPRHEAGLSTDIIEEDRTW